MKQKLKYFVVTAILIFVFYSAWWLFLSQDRDFLGLTADNFADSYGILALIGGVGGLFIARKWGGFKSALGKALMAFSLGLLAQAFGQAVYSVYFYWLDQEIPYPSIGDIGYFGSVLLYIYGTYLLVKSTGSKITLKAIGGKIMAVLLPAVLLLVSYYIFLREYETDWSQPLTVLLDFGYPLGQAIYISLALLAFLLSRKLLGGRMRGRIILLITALAIQYAADFNFLLQNHRETWTAGGYGDYWYLVAYFIMTLALYEFGTLFWDMRKKTTGVKDINSEKDTPEEAV